jgi:hypothetical protein
MRLRLKTNRIRPNLQRKNKELQGIAKEAHDKFVAETPIRTGNARRKTRLQGKTIKADYAYAQRLDEGWSKQSPDGMSKPTIEFIKDRIDEILG